MALSAFDDKAKPPRPADLAATMGRSSAHWTGLISHLAAEYAPLTEKWGFSGAQWGWSLRLIQKKRTILYLTPREKHFLVGFVLGERAVAAARQAGLPDAVEKAIETAPRYAEGRGVRLEVRTKKEVEAVKKLARIKMEH